METVKCAVVFLQQRVIRQQAMARCLRQATLGILDSLCWQDRRGWTLLCRYQFC